MSRPHPLSTRLGRRRADMELVRAASRSIAELSAALDRQLGSEERPGERMRMLREVTNQVTRIANDAVQAYGRVRSTITSELDRPEGDQPGARQMQRDLSRSRADVLRALEAMKERYAWGYPDSTPAEDGEPATDAD